MIIDHVALEVTNLDQRIRALGQAGLQVLRFGTRYSTGQRIVMMGDGTGTKLELIEISDKSLHGAEFAHIALRTDDVDNAFVTLKSAGWKGTSEPHELAAARARSALLDSGDGLLVQLISYETDSPDTITWHTENPTMTGTTPAGTRCPDAGTATSESFGG